MTADEFIIFLAGTEAESVSLASMIVNSYSKPLNKFPIRTCQMT